MAAPARPSSRIMLDSLTAVRGPAALLVFGYHVIHGTQWAKLDSGRASRLRGRFALLYSFWIRAGMVVQQECRCKEFLPSSLCEGIPPALLLLLRGVDGSSAVWGV